MLKKALTLATAIVAIGGAFAGNANARNLLAEQGWYFSDPAPGEEGVQTTEAAHARCPDGLGETCAYQDDGTGNIIDQLNYA